GARACQRARWLDAHGEHRPPLSASAQGPLGPSCRRSRPRLLGRDGLAGPDPHIPQIAVGIGEVPTVASPLLAAGLDNAATGGLLVATDAAPTSAAPGRDKYRMLRERPNQRFGELGACEGRSPQISWLASLSRRTHASTPTSTPYPAGSRPSAARSALWCTPPTQR